VTNGEANPYRPWLLRTPFRAATAWAVPLILLACAVNVTTALHDAGPHLPLWKPVSWEASSAIGVFACLVIVDRALRAAPPGARPAGYVLAVHAAAATAFSLLHCAIMWSTRWGFYALAGAPFGWPASPSEIFYEYRKDIVTYLILAGGYWAAARIMAGAPASIPPVGAPEVRPPAALDIRDGAKLVRAPIADIVAAEAAGNYVTIMLRDGQRPLMRTTLTALQETLAPSGFQRVHRGWLINPARIRLMEPTGTGDYRLTLEGGVIAPLSRRYTDLVRQLRDAAAVKG
jgi:hypothetical protein